LKIITEIENSEIIEKALLDEYNKTMSKRDEKEKKLKEINDQYNNVLLSQHPDDIKIENYYLNLNKSFTIDKNNN